jgi:hypothetical protein
VQLYLDAEGAKNLQDSVQPNRWLSVFDAVNRSHCHVGNQRKGALVHVLSPSLGSNHRRDDVDHGKLLNLHHRAYFSQLVPSETKSARLRISLPFKRSYN